MSRNWKDYVINGNLNEYIKIINSDKEKSDIFAAIFAKSSCIDAHGDIYERFLRVYLDYLMESGAVFNYEKALILAKL
jgi:hypothetical protein